MDEITRKLYGIDPAQFTAARTQAAADAKASGEAKAAAEIAKLRKPTVGAWAINLLAINKPDLIKQLIELSGKLRAAQRDLQGATLRELAQERRRLIPALVAAAQKLAGKTNLPLFEIEATLAAALADEEVAATVQSGRLAKTVAYAGLGEAVLAEAPVRAMPAPKQNRELAEAREAATAAQDGLDRAEVSEQKATRALSEVDDELHELRQRRAAVAEELNQARHALRFAQRALTAATRRVHELDPGS